MDTLPLGVVFLRKFKFARSVNRSHLRYYALVFTFIAYVAFFMSRKPFAVYKTVMLNTCTNASVKTTDCSGYKPFDEAHGKTSLGLLDAIFVGAYAIALYAFTGICERMNLRYCISLSCLFTCFFTCLVGLSFQWGIHDYQFFMMAVALNGIAQSVAWPVVLAVASNWSDEEQRNSMGFRLWNTHIYIGDLLGLFVSGTYVEKNIGEAFIVPGIAIGLIGLLMFFFLVPHPSDLDDLPPANRSQGGSESVSDELPSWFQAKNAIPFRVALCLPGVVEFAVGLLFSMTVSYTFSTWLPFYINRTTLMGPKDSAFYSMPFTAGGMVGGLLAGYLYDFTNCAALICTSSMLLSIPVLYFRDLHLTRQRAVGLAFEIFCGILVLGPYTLINTVVASELGTNKYIRRDQKAFPKVAAIIEGTGSVGAAIGPAVTGAILGESWSFIITLMMVLEFFAALCLTRAVINDVRFATKRKVARHVPDAQF